MVKTFRWSLLLPALLLISACGNATPGSPAAEPTAAGSVAPTAAVVAAGDDLVVDKSRLTAELRFFNWTDYISPEIVSQFETEYGVKLIVDNYDANEDMIAKVRAGNSGYDIVVPSDYAVDILADDSQLQALDKTLLPNMRYMEPSLLDKYFDKGNNYSVPYMYGITGIAYNAKSFPNGIDSWSALFDTAQLEPFRGQVSMLDDERETPGAVLKFLGQSLNNTDISNLTEVEQLLIAQKPLLAAYNSSDVNRKLASGEYVIAHAWNGMAMQARNGLGDDFAGNPDIRFVIPKEGGLIWMDNMAILKDSPNAYTAHVFMNFMMRPEVAAANAAYIGYLTPNKDGTALLPDDIKALYVEGFAPNDEMYKRLEWAERNETTAAFSRLWTTVKGE